MQRIFLNCGEKGLLAEIHFLIGRNNFQHSYFDKAKFQFKECIKLAQGKVSNELLLECYLLLASCYNKLGKREKSLNFCQSLIFPFLSSNFSASSLQFASFQSTLAQVHRDLGHLHDALQCETTSLAIHRTLLGDLSSATLDAYKRIGELYCLVGRYQESIACLEKFAHQELVDVEHLLPLVKPYCMAGEAEKLKNLILGLGAVDSYDEVHLEFMVQYVLGEVKEGVKTEKSMGSIGGMLESTEQSTLIGPFTRTISLKDKNYSCLSNPSTDQDDFSHLVARTSSAKSAIDPCCLAHILTPLQKGVARQNLQSPQMQWHYATSCLKHEFFLVGALRYCQVYEHLSPWFFCEQQRDALDKQQKLCEVFRDWAQRERATPAARKRRMTGGESPGGALEVKVEGRATTSFYYKPP